MAQNTIYIVDVTNSDGVQTSRLGLAKLEKTIINQLLNEMGIYQSEFGFPRTKHETNYLNANLELAEMGALSPIKLQGRVRASASRVQKAFRYVPKLKYVNVDAPVSDDLVEGQFLGAKTRQQVLDETIEAVKTAKDLGAEVIGVNAEGASDAEMDFLIEVASRVKEAGAARFRYCDSLGLESPFSIYDRVKTLAEQVKMDIGLHCHNDLGMAVAASVAGARAAIDAGVNAYINTTINGFGERAGNADLVSVILALRKSSGANSKYQLDPKVDLSKSWEIAKYASYAFGIPIPINQVAVGANAFAHESGIHADGALKDRKNYELYDHEELGRGEPEIIETGRMITTGEYGGIKGFYNVYEKLEVEFKNEKEAQDILELARYANVHTQKPLTDKELKFLAKYPEIARKVMTVNA